MYSSTQMPPFMINCEQTQHEFIAAVSPVMTAGPCEALDIMMHRSGTGKCLDDSDDSDTRGTAHPECVAIHLTPAPQPQCVIKST